MAPLAASSETATCTREIHEPDATASPQGQFCSQAPYHTARHGDEDALQYNNSLSGVTGKVGAGGNNYSRPEGQNVRASARSLAPGLRQYVCSASALMWHSGSGCCGNTVEHCE